MALRELTNDEIENILDKIEWEGGIDAFVDYGAESYVEGTTLEPLFEAYKSAKIQIEKALEELENKLGEDNG